MAKEISVNVVITATKGFVSIDRRNDYTADMSGGNPSSVWQTIGTAEELLSINADIGTPGMSYFRNTDATSSIQIGVVHSGVFVPLFTIAPGRDAHGELATASVYAKAIGASAILEHTVLPA